MHGLLTHFLRVLLLLHLAGYSALLLPSVLILAFPPKLFLLSYWPVSPLLIQ